MATDKGRPLPKFGEWDVNNPASADGFTVIFAKARDEKKTTGTAANAAPPSQRNDMSQPPRHDPTYQHPPPVLLFVGEEVVLLFLRPCCFSTAVLSVPACLQ
ncbi:uncharacterized protein LOC130768613 isoform X1 [Actinidia eriantha]|uniref:uncharacterized protein LOC130768613 isoform X1 n=1 Tax=Actinidia eriantha TaxID=165200 RepID=UPI00258DA82A|nr:uncharacterized protein LOC130768613 isoform X1 [Actinidia eriantha]